jgi:hypothetical protein
MKTLEELFFLAGLASINYLDSGFLSCSWVSDLLNDEELLRIETGLLIFLCDLALREMLPGVDIL